MIDHDCSNDDYLDYLVVYHHYLLMIMIYHHCYVPLPSAIIFILGPSYSPAANLEVYLETSPSPACARPSCSNAKASNRGANPNAMAERQWSGFFVFEVA